MRRGVCALAERVPRVAAPAVAAATPWPMNARRLRPPAGRNSAPQLQRRANRRSGSSMGVPPAVGSFLARLIWPTLELFPAECLPRLHRVGMPAQRAKWGQVLKFSDLDPR